jgi:large subunit ribosomal protein L1
MSFSAEALTENFATLLGAIRKARPSGAKGIYIKKLVVSSTMGPGIKVDIDTALGMDAVEK